MTICIRAQNYRPEAAKLVTAVTNRAFVGFF